MLFRSTPQDLEGGAKLRNIHVHVSWCASGRYLCCISQSCLPVRLSTASWSLYVLSQVEEVRYEWPGERATRDVTYGVVHVSHGEFTSYASVVYVLVERFPMSARNACRTRVQCLAAAYRLPNNLLHAVFNIRELRRSRGSFRAWYNSRCIFTMITCTWAARYVYNRPSR